MNSWRILQGDVRDKLAELPAGSVQTCVTSPPYWGLRDYGVSGQLGLERTPEAYVAAMVCVFTEVRRVLSDDGTLWLNLGDSYAGGGRANGDKALSGKQGSNRGSLAMIGRTFLPPNLAAKQLIGIPWRVAFALQADGWYLRSDIIWSKPNPMPESVTDRPTKAHEYIFLLSKSRSYYYDADAIRERHAECSIARMQGGYPINRSIKPQDVGRKAFSGVMAGAGEYALNANGANKRTVWTVTTQPYPDAHFATFPEDLIEPCILAGSAHGDTVLDPFTGSGTTGAVAIRHQRNFIGTELNPSYVELARKRIGSVAPMFAKEVA